MCTLCMTQLYWYSYWVLTHSTNQEDKHISSDLSDVRVVSHHKFRFIGHKWVITCGGTCLFVDLYIGEVNLIAKIQKFVDTTKFSAINVNIPTYNLTSQEGISPPHAKCATGTVWSWITKWNPLCVTTNHDERLDTLLTMFLNWCRLGTRTATTVRLRKLTMARAEWVVWQLTSGVSQIWTATAGLSREEIDLLNYVYCCLQWIEISNPRVSDSIFEDQTRRHVPTCALRQLML